MNLLSGSQFDNNSNAKQYYMPDKEILAKAKKDTRKKNKTEVKKKKRAKTEIAKEKKRAKAEAI